MILGFLAQRLIWHAVVFTEFSLMLNEAALKIWFPWLEQDSVQSDYVFIDGPNELGYQLVARNSNQVEEEQFLDLDEYRYLLKMRNAGEEVEGVEAVGNELISNWRN